MSKLTRRRGPQSLDDFIVFGWIYGSMDTPYISIIYIDLPPDQGLEISTINRDGTRASGRHCQDSSRMRTLEE